MQNAKLKQANPIYLTRENATVIIGVNLSFEQAAMLSGIKEKTLYSYHYEPGMGMPVLKIKSTKPKKRNKLLIPTQKFLDWLELITVDVTR